MKTSVNLFLTDILPHRRKLYHKIVKNNIFLDYSPDEVFEKLKKAGVEGIEICLPQYEEMTDFDVAELQKILKKHDMPVFSAHQALRFFTTTKITEIMRLMEIAKMLSAKLVVLHMNSAQKQIFDPTYIKALHALELKYGITVTFENMERLLGTNFYKHRWDKDMFPELVYKSGFHITFDVVHLAHSGGDILEFYQKNKDQILNIHLSDYKYNLLNSTLRPLRYKHMLLGAGDLPLITLLDMLQKDHYKGLVTMEIHTNLQGVCEGAKIINAHTS